MYIFAVIQWLSHVQLFATPWTAVRQASLSLTISQSLLKLMSFPASGSFPVDQLFASGGQSIGASASATVFPMNMSLEVHYSSYWNEWFSFSASSQTFGVFTVFYFSHSGMCVVILHCVVLICSSLVGNDVEYVFMCLCAIYTSFSAKCLFLSFADFLIRLFGIFCCGILKVFCIFQILVLCWICGLQVFSPTL